LKNTPRLIHRRTQRSLTCTSQELFDLLEAIDAEKGEQG
jgi:hypothetical protein